jgi:hypothetical protein
LGSRLFLCRWWLLRLLPLCCRVLLRRLWGFCIWRALRGRKRGLRLSALRRRLLCGLLLLHRSHLLLLLHSISI